MKPLVSLPVPVKSVYIWGYWLYQSISWFFSDTPGNTIFGLKFNVEFKFALDMGFITCFSAILSHFSYMCQIWKKTIFSWLYSPDIIWIFGKVWWRAFQIILRWRHLTKIDVVARDIAFWFGKLLFYTFDLITCSNLFQNAILMCSSWRYGCGIS